MSAVTLDSLKAEWDRYLTIQDAIFADCESYTSYYGGTYTYMGEHFAYGAIYDLIVRSGDMYKIACDHGLEAAMLYKLSGGNMDPRVAE